MAATKRGQEDVHIAFHNDANTAVYFAQNKLNTTKLPQGFMVVPERGTNPDLSTSTKLHWDKLNRSVKGVRSPHENKGWITRRFNELESMGWSVTNKS